MISAMELHFPSATMRPSFQFRAGKLPPSPPEKLPVIGHIHHLLGAMPHRALRELSSRHGPFMHLRLGQVDHIIASSPEAARDIMKTHDLAFASRPQLLAPFVMFYGGKDIAFSPMGDYWRQLRRICMQELLSPKRVKSFSTCRQEEMSNLVEAISKKSGSPVNLSEMLLLSSNSFISRVAFGKKCRHGLRFITIMKKALEVASGFSIADLFPSWSFVDALTGITSRIKKARQEIDEILEEILKEHEEKREGISSKEDQLEEEDLVDVLLDVAENGELEIPLTRTHLKCVILDMFVGGTETASTTLEWVMVELMRHPEMMQKAQAEVRQALKEKANIKEEDMSELHYLKLVIKETMRLHPALPLLLPRSNSENCQVGDYEIPAGTRVIVNAWAIARDPRYWEDPESFRPERFDDSMVDYMGSSFEFMPFGAGRRICPGSTFAMAQMEIALAYLLFYFDWELPNGMEPQDLDMTESFGGTTGLKSPLCLVPVPFKPSENGTMLPHISMKAPLNYY
ncbi:premnaspirodiene oxygenase-like [Phoenix dactylifera]|uniref:Premnaspirodiene oxygenase-like n=1 Tax=Phoenix dactylifera TaxID=42345 RepID=A0A8B7CW06_PHODC|nr:premnaspirodiene oxygenase-like [Phoenix dactylifera]